MYETQSQSISSTNDDETVSQIMTTLSGSDSVLIHVDSPAKDSPAQKIRIRRLTIACNDDFVLRRSQRESKKPERFSPDDYKTPIKRNGAKASVQPPKPKKARRLTMAADISKTDSKPIATSQTQASLTPPCIDKGHEIQPSKPKKARRLTMAVETPKNSLVNLKSIETSQTQASLAPPSIDDGQAIQPSNPKKARWLTIDAETPKSILTNPKFAPTSQTHAILMPPHMDEEYADGSGAVNVTPPLSNGTNTPTVSNGTEHPLHPQRIATPPVKSDFEEALELLRANLTPSDAALDGYGIKNDIFWHSKCPENASFHACGCGDSVELREKVIYAKLQCLPNVGLIHIKPGGIRLFAKTEDYFFHFFGLAGTMTVLIKYECRCLSGECKCAVETILLKSFNVLRVNPKMKYSIRNETANDCICYFIR